MPLWARDFIRGRKAPPHPHTPNRTILIITTTTLQQVRPVQMPQWDNTRHALYPQHRQQIPLELVAQIIRVLVHRHRHHRQWREIL